MKHFIHCHFAVVLISYIFIIELCGCSQNAKLKSEGPQFAFGVVADIQYADSPPVGDRFPRLSLSKLEDCVEDFNVRNLAFAIQLGDIIDTSLQTDLDKVLNVYNQLTMSKYHVIGNHCIESGWPLLSEKLGLARPYYEFTAPSAKGWRFIVLYGNDISFCDKAGYGENKNSQAKVMYHELIKEKAVNAALYNGALGHGQLTWLDNCLDKAAQNNEKVILFCHMPVYPENLHNLWNDREVISIIESHKCVVAYLNGHNHAGNFDIKTGVSYLNLHGMMDTWNTNAYATIEVYPDRLEIVGRGREPQRIITLDKN